MVQVGSGRLSSLENTGPAAPAKQQAGNRAARAANRGSSGINRVRAAQHCLGDRAAASRTEGAGAVLYLAFSAS